MDFDAWVGGLRDVLQLDKNYIDYHQGRWQIGNRVLSWKEFGSRIFDDHLDVFRSSAVDVLGEIDPQFQLATDERYAAGIHGKVLKHSDNLREGIAETLALLGNQGAALINCSQRKPEDTALQVIRDLFVGADWSLWGSLNHLLPILAEAAPNEFLNAVQEALNRDEPPFDELYRQEGSGTFGRTYISGLLWALEGLAWSEDYLVRVATLLAELASRDSGGTWSNRPDNSLVSILLPWFPQTTASISKRYACVIAIQHDHPRIAWQVLISLLPSQHQTSSGTHKPSWIMSLPEDWKPTVTNVEYHEQVTKYSEMAIEMAFGDLDRITELVGILDNLPEPSFESLLSYLASNEVVSLDEEQRLPIWTKLIDSSLKHRRFQDANWSLSPEVIDRIDTVSEKLAPESPEGRYKRLFGNRDFDLYEETGNWEDQRRKLDEKRKQAALEVWKYRGLEGLLAFLDVVESSFQLGLAFGSIADSIVEEQLLPGSLVQENNDLLQFMNGFVWSRFQNNGYQWVDELDSAQWSSPEKCQFLIFLPFDDETWRRAADWLGGEEKTYWDKVVVNPYGTEGDLIHAVDRLLEVSRSKAALDCLFVRLHKKLPLDQERTIKVLLDAVASEEEPRNTMDHHHVTELIKVLQDDPNTEPDALFMVEWAYLPLLDKHGDAEPKLLEKKLANQPDFFCEVIRLIYRPKGAEPAEEIDEAKQRIASNAWRLLHDWKRPPGLRDDGSFSAGEFREWLARVKEQCSESGHFEVAMVKAGKVFLYCPEDPNGLWINEDVAKELNSKDAEDMRSGFRTEVYNSRGVHWVDPTGQPEKDLAQKWRDRAEAVEGVGYVRFGTALRSLSDSYDKEAERVVVEHNHKE